MLLQAAYSYRPDGEDRLTEIFATALSAHPGFCRSLFEELSLLPGKRYIVKTQHRVSSECRVDLRIEARGEHDEVSAVVYSEHKIDGYWFSEGQVARERKGLDAEPASAKRLISIVSEGELAELLAADPAAPLGMASAVDFDKALSWNDIAQLAHEAGAGWPAPWGGTDWARHALEPDAPAAQRILSEFLTYVQRDEVMDPLSADDIRAFHLADQAQAKVEQLLRVMAPRVASFSATPDGNDELVYDDSSSTGVLLTCVNFDAPEGHWLLGDDDNALTVAVATADAGAPWESEDPVVYTGLYVAPPTSAAAEADSAWMAAADSQSLRPLAYDEGLWLCRSRPLYALLEPPRGRLEDQAKALSEWVTEALQAAISLPEPPDEPPAAPGRKRR